MPTKRNSARFFAALLLGPLLGLVSCGPRILSSTTNPAPLSRLINLDRPTLRSTGQGYAGEGRLLSTDPLRGVNSNEHFVLETQDWASDGALILQTHMNDFSFLDGVQIEMRRHHQDLLFRVSTPGYPMTTVFTLASAFSSETSRLRLRLEVHDGIPEGLRLLIWKDLLPGQEELFHPLPFLSAANAQFDSRNETKVWRSHGRGPRWGLQIRHVTLTDIRNEAPYVLD